MIRIGITGKPKIGKSTIIKEIIKRFMEQNVIVGGVITSEIKKEGKRIGFLIEDINTGRKGILAHVNQEGPKVGKYGVNIRDLDTLGAKVIKEAKKSADMIIIDEIGPMELKSKNFILAVNEAMDSDKSMMVSVHQKSVHELVNKIKESFRILEVTEENREEMVEKILEMVSVSHF